MAEVRGRFASANCRRSSNKPDWVIRSRYWPNRRPYLVKALKESGASVIGTQECTKQQAGDITHDLGARFSYFGGDGDGNGPVIWDTLKWDVGEAFEKEIEAPGERYMVAVRLASRPPKNFGQLWAVTVHLTVGDSKTAQEYRHKQIRAAIREMQRHDGWHYSAIFGDFNSDGYNNGPLGGVRTVAAELGYQDLRTLLKNDQVTKYNYSSSNGWGVTPKDGRWIDDILTPAWVKPYAAEVVLTDKSQGTYCGSDHNIVRASMAWDSEKET